ncbi:MAG TPA: glycosyltransferase family 39 protein, partial [Planctomycetaceae bacterium]|nr:glycosyltransferase family 39 protein [Planctomycetaceae bacterium]
MTTRGAAPETPIEPKRSVVRFWLPVAAVLAVQAAFGITAAAQLTPTHDEYWHLPIGLLNLKTGRFDFDDLNPPLCRMLAALPLTVTSARTGPADVHHDPMGWGDAFIAENREHYQRWFTLGRSMIVILSVLGGLTLAVWARELFGNGAGILAALFWSFEPNLVAHGSLVTTDMGAAAFFVFVLYAAWRFARRPGWTSGLVFGALLGLAQLAKFTCLVLYPISMVVLVLVIAIERTVNDSTAVSREGSPTGARRPGGLKLVAMWLAALVLSLTVWNAGYLFRGSFSKLQSYDFQSSALKQSATRFALLSRLPIPLPRDYVTGLDHQRQIMEQKHPVFLDGQWREQGFPGYYAWALLYKVPHALQLLSLLVLLWIVVPGGRSRRLLTQAAILIPAVVVLAVAESSPMQLGIRYVLPVIPFIVLFASQAAGWLDFKTFPVRSLMTIGLAALMLLSLRYHPEHLSYFNEFAGGPLGGREHLLDSNLDWGQDLGGLERYLSEHPAKGADQSIGLAYFGTVPPAALGIRYSIAPEKPQPGRFAVSVNFEQGRPHWVRTPDNKIQPVNIGQFEYFGFFQPVARIGYSID